MKGYSMDGLLEYFRIFVCQHAGNHGPHDARFLDNLAKCEHAIMHIVWLHTKKDRLGDVSIQKLAGIAERCNHKQ